MKIKRLLQIVSQANENWLLPKESLSCVLRDALSMGGDLAKTPKYSGDKLKRPYPQTIFVRPDGSTDSFSRPKTPRAIPYIQKIIVKHKDTEGRSYQDRIIDPVRYYERFIELKNINELEEFIEKFEFSIFPNAKESELLLEKYETGGIAIPPIFYSKIRDENTKDAPARKLAQNVQKKIFEINLNFIWEKQQALQKVSSQYADGSLEYHKLHWINQQMENVSEVLIDKDHKIYKEASDWPEEIVTQDNRDLKSIVGMRIVKDLSITPAIRFYGHYALCCYTLYRFILADRKIAICNDPECDFLFIPKRASQIYCNNHDCIQRRNNRKSKISYQKRTKK